ncbi:MAG: hypothetical protein H6Q85_2851, partial [candidate division NC10 bacterium]|nr:hypothetical protein [candidate division NC10 bacterium]
FTVLMLAGSVYTVATVAWLAAAYYLIQAMANTRSGVLLWSAALAFFPPNIVFRPDLLTERGRVFRRRFGAAALVCVAAVATALALSGLVRVLA